MNNVPTLSDILARGFKEETVVLSQDLRVVCANDAFLEANRLQADEIAGRPCHEILKSCQEFCKEFTGECPVHEALATDEPVSVTHLDVPIADEIRHYKVDIYPVTPDDTGEIFFLHITRDITRRIEEERLKENMWMEILSRMEQLYAAMVQGDEQIAHIYREIDHLTEIVPLAMVGWNRDGKIIRWNQNAEVLFGWPSNEVLDKPFKSFFASGPSQERFSDITDKILKGQSLIYALAENRTASGHIISCEWYHSPLSYGEQGEITDVLSMGHDASARLDTEKALRKAQTQLEAVLKAAGDAIIGINNLGRITLWNPAAEKLFGWLEREIIGREVEVLIPADLRPSHGKKLRSFFSKSKKGEKHLPRISMETIAQRRDGMAIPVEMTLSAAAIDDRLGGIAVMHDISDKKRVEKILMQSEKLRSLGEMAGGVAHDFNNSLTTILGNIQLLKKNGLEGNSAEKLAAIEMAARQGAHSIAGLQGFSRDTSGDEKQDSLELLRLETLISDVRDLTRFRWKDLPQKEGHTIRFTTDIAETPAMMLNGPDIKEMLTNIIFNAIDALPQGGHIHISVRQDNNQVILQVRDNGAGMSPEEVQHVFDPFFTTKGGGHAGLGLNMAQRIAVRHNGNISVESIKGVGTTFTLLLPLLTTSDIDKLPKPPAHDVSLKILLIDDEKLVRELLRQVLEAAGHEIVEADNGRDGVRAFRDGDFDLVITDHGMPVMSGQDAAFRIKKQKPRIPVLMISGWGADYDAHHLKTSGIDEVITKPFDLDKLLELVRTYGSRQRQKTAGKQ